MKDVQYDTYVKQLDKKTLIDGNKYMYYILGLTGEAGEVADKFKKIYRDTDGDITDTNRVLILKELGDVLWYVTALAHKLDSNITEVQEINMAKLTSRLKRNVIAGSGDER